MTIYLIPYRLTELANAVNIYGLEPHFFYTEIIGNKPLEYGSIYTEDIIDTICEIKNMATSALSMVDNIMTDLEITDLEFAFKPTDIECALLVQEKFIRDIPRDLLSPEHDLIFPDEKYAGTRNGIFLVT